MDTKKLTWTLQRIIQNVHTENREDTKILILNYTISLLRYYGYDMDIAISVAGVFGVADHATDIYADTDFYVNTVHAGLKRLILDNPFIVVTYYQAECIEYRILKHFYTTLKLKLLKENLRETKMIEDILLS